MHRDFRLFALCVDDFLGGGNGSMYRTTVKDHPVYAALVQTAIERLFRIAFGEKLRMAHFHAIRKRVGQTVEKGPKRRKILRAKRCRQLQPVLTDAPGKGRQARKELLLKIVALA